MSSSEAIKIAMAACEKGVAALEARVKTNGALVEAKEKERLAWSEQQNTHNTNCNNETTNRQTAQRSWDDRRTEIYNSKNNEEQNVRNRSCSNFQGSWCQNDYGNGWEHKRNDTDWANCGYVVCKKTHDQKMNEATSQVSNERGGRPGDYVCPAFRDYPGDAQLDTSPITVGCCANQTNIIGSELKDTAIQQQNNCLSNLQNDLNAAQKAEAEKKTAEAAAQKAEDERKAAADRAAAAKAAEEMTAAAQKSPQQSNTPAIPQAATSQEVGTAAVQSTDSTENNKQRYIIIAAIVAALCCCLIMFFISMMMM